MIVRFKIHYQTRWGQQIAVAGNIPELGDGETGRAFALQYEGDGFWGASLDLPEPPRMLAYKYVLIDENDGARRPEWGDYRQLDLSGRPPEVFARDSWRAKGHPEHALYTSAFLDVILRPGQFKARPLRAAAGKPVLRFRLRAPRVPSGLQLCVTGNIAELGNWETDRPLLLGNAEHPLWAGAVALSSGLGVEYKYGMYDPQRKRIVRLEEGDNRRLPAYWIEPGRQLVVTDEYYRHPGGLWRGTGMAIPVFSLRTRRGLGVGEFTDLKATVDWARKVGLRMVQILPVNDTSATGTWVDSYPYAAISVFALHPLYLNIDALGDHLEGPDLRTLLEERERLNALDVVDYEAVMKLKLRLARQVFETVKDDWRADAGFQSFFRENRHWLEPYGAFCYLRDKYGTVDFNQWDEHSRFSKDLLRRLTDPKAAHHDEVAFHYFIQYHLDRQLGEAARYAREQGVILKGDIPIGIYRYSVDAWLEPHLYNMNGQSGAPPDPFSEIGQNWGFPTYNWTEMARDGYRWWRQRLQQLSRYFDAFRIDHILGFFRIWEIPYEQIEGLMGRFNPALPVTREEFDQRGIPFSYERFCRPYIPEHYLYERFGNDASYVKQTFLEPDRPYHYRFKPEFDTQRKIESFLDRPDNAARRHLRTPLFELVANVLFFEEPGSDRRAFHPRIMMETTRSYRELDADTQRKLQDLYLNYFFRRQEEFWRQQAMTKLPAIKDATNMLICGEDLGMVPDCVPGVMRDLDILSLEIQRMSKNPKTEFLHVSDIPYLSVCSPSTHDMSPLRAWWEEMESDQRQRFFRQELELPGDAPFFCEPYIVERILAKHLRWPSMWAVFPLQDLLAIAGKLRRENPFDERINIPSIPKHYWRYRLHVTLEELSANEAFNEQLHNLIRQSGR